MRLVMLALLALTSIAGAKPTVAVIVNGDKTIKKPATDVAETWAAAQPLELVSSPLSKDGLNTMVNCLVMSDMTCARGVMEARASVDNIIAITGQASGKGEKRSVQLSAYWIAKQHEVISLQRTCDACTDEVFATTLDAMLDDLAKHAPTMGGKLHVTSEPAGLPASVDGDAPATTPFDRDVGFGSHVVAIMRDGRVVAQKKVDVAPTATVDVAIAVPAEPKPMIKIVEQHRSRAAPVVLLSAGLAAAVTGGVLYKYGGPTGDNYTYRNLRPAAIATGISGGVVIIVGAVWLLHGGSTTSHPEVSINSTSTTVGWARSF